MTLNLKIKLIAKEKTGIASHIPTFARFHEWLVEGTNKIRIKQRLRRKELFDENIRGTLNIMKTSDELTYYVIKLAFYLSVSDEIKQNAIKVLRESLAREERRKIFMPVYQRGLSLPYSFRIGDPRVENVPVFFGCAWVLANHYLNEKRYDSIRTLFTNEVPNARAGAINSLTNMLQVSKGHTVEPLIQDLFDMLNDKNEGVTREVALALATAIQQGLKIEAFIPQIEDKITKSDGWARSNLIDALGASTWNGTDISSSIDTILYANSGSVPRDSMTFFSSKTALAKAILNEKSRETTVNKLIEALGNQDNGISTIAGNAFEEAFTHALVRYGDNIADYLVPKLTEAIVKETSNKKRIRNIFEVMKSLVTHWENFIEKLDRMKIQIRENANFEDVKDKPLYREKVMALASVLLIINEFKNKLLSKTIDIELDKRLRPAHIKPDNEVYRERFIAAA